MSIFASLVRRRVEPRQLDLITPDTTMLISDFRYAVRTLSRAPGFALTVILTLGLGIGANTAIFSVVRGVLLRPLPHKDGDRLVYLRHSMKGPLSLIHISEPTRQ